MKAKAITAVLTIVVLASMLSVMTPALAQPGLGPKYPKYVAPLEDGLGVRYGQAIFNTNPEDDGKYELEVEIEECSALADSTVNVYLDDTLIGTIVVDLYGNGKATFYVDAISEITSHIDVDTTLTGGVWHLWVKAPGPK